MSSIQPIPESWRKDVIGILRRGDSRYIGWTYTAETDWHQFGDRFQAYELLKKTLSSHGILGCLVSGMHGASEVWEFLCPNPIEGSIKPLYAKIGIQANRLSIKIFSTHIDRTGKLETAIKAYWANNSTSIQ